MDNLDLILLIVEREGMLCPFCLGSIIGSRLEVPNYIKGAALREMLKALNRGKGNSCAICNNLIPKSIGSMVNEALNKLKEVEFRSLKAAVILPTSIIENEDRLRARYNPPYMESVKLTLIKWLDLVLSSEVDAEVSNEPDVLVTFDFSKRNVSLRISPIFIYGRYRKLKRGISQSRRKCPYCGGKGCEKCNWTGKIAEGSIEGMIGEIMKDAFKAKDYVLHGAGREDVDARMLGRGRPFVMEVISPRKRTADLELLENEINSRWRGIMEVREMRYTKRDEVVRIKESSPNVRKLYRAVVKVEGVITEEDLDKIEKSLTNATIKQRTPKRVLWRRADLVRVRKVYEVKTRKIDDSTFEMTVLCDGGLYVKELISGDDGRTKPSVTEVLGKKAFCRELDVLEVFGH